MANPFVGEIRMGGWNFAPVGWAFCDGSIQSIAQNNTLFNLIGTTYGGNGTTTFALPNLLGRFPIHQGTDTFGNPYVMGQLSGTETVTLTSNQIPIHSHTAGGQSTAGTQAGPGNGVWAVSSLNQYSSSAPSANMNAAALASAGSSQPHDNMIPFLAINFVISLFGIFPSQN